MKITFPNLGNTCLAAKAVFDGLGIDYVLPPKSNKNILEAGCLYSPEEICLPFKIMIGSYIESIKKGADTILLVGSCGPCRFGEYCELQMNILKNLGYNLKFIVLDSPKDIGMKEFIRRLSEINNESHISAYKKLKALSYGLKIINLIDAIEKKAEFLSGYEINKGQCKNILNQCKASALKSTTPFEMLSILKGYKNKLNNVPVDKNKNPLKIAIIGEIYTIIEPFSNLFIESKLIDYGVSVNRYITPSWWVKDTILSIVRLNSPIIRKCSKKYLPLYIGGHARECIGNAVLAKKKGFDGAIQIFPMGCMPEIVSKSILPTISKEEDFPILTLVVDELTGEDGYITRIEAFLDLLERRKNNVLYGN
ncbi:putative nucleotide-binding protein (sugar kinase/HSP70/actin superfamily) [Clostridium algifaecis]|uniref:Nucleotide-binding protein (Sugar kinase/HSP70/actin superfamily) n=1 Tax=Clostridium algifaecis TaxID=1472040 RepID=A0ABS4KP47_9CLOT|nr:acyl-CoA dehydratase activase-related protein [Clostridium algifaecis]MBP2031808.1 putative nucleotide-binding protein (sugar kinase/HSP70/actin superfamily) [Clostridium algifaecis]